MPHSDPQKLRCQPPCLGSSCWLIVALTLLTGSVTAAEPLTKNIDRVTRQTHFLQSHWGGLFVDLETGNRVFHYNSEKLFVPASTAKLYSVACALNELGPSFQFVTPVVRKGDVDAQGVLNGDLIVVMSGDLSLGGRTDAHHVMAYTNVDHTYATDNLDARLTETDPLNGLNQLAKQVTASGIRQVQGDVLIDHRLFDDSDSSGSGPRRVSACIVNDNVIDLIVTPTHEGMQAKVVARPVTTMIHVESKVTTVKRNGAVQISVHDAGHGKIEVSGKIPEGHRPVIKIQEVHEPAAFARSLFIEALHRAGVTVKASLAAEPSTHALPPRSEVSKLPHVATFHSPPFSDSATVILKVSHNLHASALPLLVAAKHGEHTLEQGLKRQREFLKNAGVDVASISFSGGAGGSRGDLISPASTVELLRFMSRHPSFGVYYNALPRLGIDGTLADLVGHDNPMRDKVHAKTGTLYFDNKMNGTRTLASKSLAGYMTTARGQHLVFALFVNNAQLHDGITSKTFAEDLVKICEAVYHHE